VKRRLAGRPAVFKVKINEIKEQQLPAIDDEFAKDISEFFSLEAYKERYAQQTQHTLWKNESAAEFENRLIDKVIDNMYGPQCPIAWSTRRMEELVRILLRALLSKAEFGRLYQVHGEDKEKFKESFRPQSLRQVKSAIGHGSHRKKRSA
jgi:trigger factor